jgi:hypothetical protein
VEPCGRVCNTGAAFQPQTLRGRSFELTRMAGGLQVEDRAAQCQVRWSRSPSLLVSIAHERPRGVPPMFYAGNVAQAGIKLIEAFGPPGGGEIEMGVPTTRPLHRRDLSQLLAARQVSRRWGGHVYLTTTVCAPQSQQILDPNDISRRASLIPIMAGRWLPPDGIRSLQAGVGSMRFTSSRIPSLTSNRSPGGKPLSDLSNNRPRRRVFFDRQCSPAP